MGGVEEDACGLKNSDSDRHGYLVDHFIHPRGYLDDLASCACILAGRLAAVHSVRACILAAVSDLVGHCLGRDAFGRPVSSRYKRGEQNNAKLQPHHRPSLSNEVIGLPETAPSAEVTPWIYGAKLGLSLC